MVKILNDAAFGYSKDSWGVPFTEACRWPWQGQEILVALNLVSEPRRFEWNGAGRLLLSTYLDKSDVMCRRRSHHQVLKSMNRTCEKMQGIEKPLLRRHIQQETRRNWKAVIECCSY
jgi:hypothetical protein